MISLEKPGNKEERLNSLDLPTNNRERAVVGLWLTCMTPRRV